MALNYAKLWSCGRTTPCRLSLRYGIPLLLNARLRAWPSVDSPSTLKAGLQLDFEPMDPPLVERTASSVEDLLRAVAHNSTMLRFKSIAADVRRAMDDLHKRLHEAAVPSGELLFVKVPNIESLLPLLKPAHFEALVNYFLEAPNKYTMSSEVVSATAALSSSPKRTLGLVGTTLRLKNGARVGRLLERGGADGPCSKPDTVPCCSSVSCRLATSDLEEALDLEAGEASKLRIRACMDAVRRVEPRTWQFLTLQEVLSKRRVTQAARVVSAVLKATLAEYARWQDNVTLARTRARLKLLRAETSLTPLTSVADANRRYEYVVPVNDDTSFFKWFTSSLYKGATLAMSASVGKLRDGDDLRQLDALRDSRVHVDPLIPVVRVSPGAMFGPFMVDDGVPPDGVNMGALGSTVGTLVAAFMDPVRGPLDGVSRTRPKYEKATASKYDAALDCLVSRTSKNGPSIVDKKEASQVLIDRLGVRIAYGAFEEMLNASSTKAGSSALMDQLSELLGSVQRTFFAAYCFQFCQHEAPNMAGHAMSGRFRCNAVLRDVEAFWKAFTCPVGSSMRPANACVI
ncbi:hypothetical protein MTO96_025535 [Rhipicephalus appendiculatus]